MNLFLASNERMPNMDVANYIENSHYSLQYKDQEMFRLVSGYIAQLSDDGALSFTIKDTFRSLSKILRDCNTQQLTATFVLENIALIDTNGMRKPFLRFLLYAIRKHAVVDDKLRRFEDFDSRIYSGAMCKGVIQYILQDKYYNDFKKSDLFHVINSSRYAYTLYFLTIDCSEFKSDRIYRVLKRELVQYKYKSNDAIGGRLNLIRTFIAISEDLGKGYDEHEITCNVFRQYLVSYMSLRNTVKFFKQRELLLRTLRTLGYAIQPLRPGYRWRHVFLFLAGLILILLLPSVFLGFFIFSGGETSLFAVLHAEIFFFRLMLPGTIFIEGAYGQHDMGMRIVTVRVVNRHIRAHTLVHKLLLNELRQQIDPFVLAQFNRQGGDELAGQSAVFRFFSFFHCVPELCAFLPFHRREVREKHTLPDKALLSCIIMLNAIILVIDGGTTHISQEVPSAF